VRYSIILSHADDPKVVPCAVYWTHEAMFTVWIIASSMIFRNVEISKVRGTLAAHIINLERGAMMELLDLVCDVVVHLGKEQTMSSHSPRLSSMLMLGSQSTLGLNLQHFMPFKDDHARFDAILQSRTQTGPEMPQESPGLHLPTACNVTLRASMGTNVRAELFCVNFSLCGNEERYVIGIREMTDGPIAEMIPHRKSRRKSNLAMKIAEQKFDLGIEDLVEVSSESSSSLPDPELGHAVSDSLMHDVISPWYAASSEEHRCCGAKSALLPHLQLTKSEAKESVLLALMMRWNVETRGVDCCAFHALVADLLQIGCRMQNRPCATSFQPLQGAQCMACGSLGDHSDRECDLCQGKMQILTMSI